MIYPGNKETLTSQPQPLPWMAAVFAFISFLNASTVPHCASILVFNCPSMTFPPPSDVGARIFQKKEWLTCPIVQLDVNTAVYIPHTPPPLNLSALWIEINCWVVDAFLRASSAALSPFTYVWWCFEWWSSIIFPEICGSNACDFTSETAWHAHEGWDITKGTIWYGGKYSAWCFEHSTGNWHCKHTASPARYAHPL